MKQLIGNRMGINQIEQWIKKPSKHLFVSGPVGIGKTSIIKTILKSTDYTIYYLDEIQRYDGAYIKSLDRPNPFYRSNQKNLIVIDHLEYNEKLYWLLEIKIPIIFIANDSYNKSIKSFKGQCHSISLSKPTST